MGTTLVTTGLACVIAAIVGGGLKAFGLELPILQSAARQGLLAIFGVILVAVGAYILMPPAPPSTREAEILLFSTKNDQRVSNNPSQPASFTISQPFYVTYIWNYHWNGGAGVTPGNIALRRNDGKVFGPWEVTAADLASRINWECKPNAKIPAGEYTVVDSESARWSWNDGTAGRGMSVVRGHPAN
jgi:hypothetical protein